MRVRTIRLTIGKRRLMFLSVREDARDIDQDRTVTSAARRLIPNMGLPPTGAAADHISKAAASAFFCRFHLPAEAQPVLGADLNRTE